MSFLTIVPIYFNAPHPLLIELKSCIERTFRLTVRFRPPWFDPSDSYEPPRRQYNSRVLLGQLLSDDSGVDSRVLGVTSCDLFCPVLQYVFGEAQLGGRAALVSIDRLRNEAYGLPPDDRRLGDRLKKEAVHELGHTYGLVHCRDAACVMYPSTYAEQIDFKSAVFCRACRARLAACRT
jgi:archaemetzincin